MSDWVALLERYEPTISAVVGLLTLLAAGWGFIQLIILSPRRIKRDAGKGRSGAREQGYLRRLWISLVDRGLDPQTDLMEQVSVRTFNVCALLLATACLIWLFATLHYGGLLILSVLNFVAFFLAIIAYNLQGMHLPAIAKWLFLALVAFYWAANVMIMGPMVGLEYFLGVLLVMPLLLFRQQQRRQRVAGVLLFVTALPVALLAQEAVALDLPDAYREVVPNYYYANAPILAGLVFWVLYLFNGAADSSFRQLEDQYAKTDELLNRLLPAYIARQYDGKEGAIADWHSEASVLFVTVQGFETLYSQISAVQLVELIRELFNDFDSLLDKHGIEKVNTLGVSYLAATGIAPGSRPDHEAIARTALAMRETVDALSAATGHTFGLRAGISTGEVISGVIGEARPNFDIWGRTVELAESMRGEDLRESIIVDRAAFWRLRARFRFEPLPSDDSRSILLGEAARSA